MANPEARSPVPSREAHPDETDIEGLFRTRYLEMVVVQMGHDGPVSTSTFAAWPGSGLRLWAVPVWQGKGLQENNGLPVVTATEYNAAGQAVARVKLGRGGG